MNAAEFDHTTIDYVLRYSAGFCRECPNHHGLCPNGLPCDVDDAKTAIRWVLKALNYGIVNGLVASPRPVTSAEKIVPKWAVDVGAWQVNSLTERAEAAEAALAATHDQLSTLRERCERLQAERGRGSSLIAELVEALEGAREALWDYGAPENDIAPIRKAIAKAASEKHP